MKRFILVTFLFLGWAFYEMSDGADFDPPERTVKAPQEPAPKPYEPNRTAAASDTLASNRTDSTSIVFKPAVKPADSGSAALPEPAASVAARQSADAAADADATPAADEEKLNQVRTSLSQGLTLYPASQGANQPLTVASLGTGSVSSASSLNTPATPSAPADVSGAVNSLLQETVGTASEATPRDIREVTGVRVNMRDGPGTIYPVVAKLGIGQQVEVLSDSGTGWLRLRTIPGNQPGWISQSLVSKVAN